MKTTLYVFGMGWEEKKALVDRLLEDLGRTDAKQHYHLIAPTSETRLVPSAEYRLPFLQDDPTLDRLIDALEQAKIRYRPERRYTRQELLEAELLELMVTGVVGEVKNERYDMSQMCRYCRHPRVQVADLIIDKGLMGKKDIAATYGYEVVITERVAQLLQEAGFSGYELRPVHHHSTRLRAERVLHQLVPTHVLPLMASPPTRVEPCPVCGKPLHDTFSEIFYPRRDLEQTGIKDFNQAQERWLVAISQRVYRLLLEQKIRKFKVEVIRILA
jgi:hypothetical protein